MVDDGLEVAYVEVGRDVADRAQRGGARYGGSQVDVGRYQVTAPVEPAGNGAGLATGGDRDLGDDRRPDALEPPQSRGRHVRGHRARAGSEHCGQGLLSPGLRVGGVPQDLAAHGDEHSLGHQGSAALTGHAERLQLVVGEEAEHRSGPLGDGPVEVTGHGPRP